MTAARKEALKRAQAVSAQKRKGMSPATRKLKALQHGHAKLTHRASFKMGASRQKLLKAAGKLWSKAGSMNR
jgi:hypothetical protein